MTKQKKPKKFYDMTKKYLLREIDKMIQDKHKYMLLGIDSNIKTSKNTKYGFLTGILYMLPDKTICPYSSKGCFLACLESAGMGIFPNVRQARKRKTMLFRHRQKFFFESLEFSINKLIKKAKKEGLTPVIRLNGTSDIPYENIYYKDGKTIFEHYPDVQFYDYTPNFDRKYALDGKIPNYHLTFSLKEDNKNEALHVKNNYKVNLAVVFKDVPKTWQGFEVIDGDNDDLRFLDVENVIVGLKAKGKAKHDVSGFVQ